MKEGKYRELYERWCDGGDDVVKYRKPAQSSVADFADWLDGTRAERKAEKKAKKAEKPEAKPVELPVELPTDWQVNTGTKPDWPEDTMVEVVLRMRPENLPSCWRNTDKISEWQWYIDGGDSDILIYRIAK